MIEFEKVSFKQFKKDCVGTFLFGTSDIELKKIYDSIKLPRRATSGSAGYDFFSPIDICLVYDGETALLPTGIRAKMPDNVCLFLLPKSGIGFKTGTTLANTMGVVDSDYYYSDNEGHIMCKFVKGFGNLDLKAGNKFMQGVFVNFLTVDTTESFDKVRNGGFGSTGE